jgi:phage terminase small subunit
MGRSTVSGKLTHKQELFCREYLVDLNASGAAERAGYSSPASSARHLMAHPDVLARIDRRIEERNQRVGVDADWVLKRLAEEVDADLVELFDADGSVKPIQQWPEVWRRGLVAGIDVFERDGSVTTKIKLSDRIKRLELIGRHVGVGAFKDRLEHTGKDGGPIETITRDMTPEEALRIYREQFKSIT